MRAADLITALVLTGLGGVVIVDAVRLGIGWGTDGPGSGFFPFWLAVVMLATCGLILLQALRRRTTTPFVTRERLRSVLTVLGPAVALVLITPLTGLYVAAAHPRPRIALTCGPSASSPRPRSDRPRAGTPPRPARCR